MFLDPLLYMIVFLNLPYFRPYFIAFVDDNFLALLAGQRLEAQCVSDGRDGARGGVLQRSTVRVGAAHRTGRGRQPSSTLGDLHQGCLF